MTSLQHLIDGAVDMLGAECTFIVLDKAHEGATSYSLDGAF